MKPTIFLIRTPSVGSMACLCDRAGKLARRCAIVGLGGRRRVCPRRTILCSPRGPNASRTYTSGQPVAVDTPSREGRARQGKGERESFERSEKLHRAREIL